MNVGLKFKETLPFLLILTALLLQSCSSGGGGSDNAADLTTEPEGAGTAAGFIVGEISGNVSESATEATFSVSLQSQPTATVFVSVSSSDTSEAKVSPENLTFTTENWDVEQTVVVTGVNDTEVDSDQAFKIVLAAAISEDDNYNSLDPVDIDAINLDDDVAPVVDKSFIRALGSQLVVSESDQPIFLRGINFSYDRVSETFCGGGEWRITDHTDWGEPVTCWYQEKHFQSASNIGFNTVRLNLSYRIFENNADPGNWKQSGWDLIDQLVAWAKIHNLYLILDMHVGPGGAGIASCMGCGWRTWDESVYQDRFISLWTAIADRYSDEPQIAAFDLLNEPVPTQSTSQWQTLAQYLIEAIRSVDTNHLLIVEMSNWIFNKNDQSPLQNFDPDVLNSFQFLVNDENVAYDYHFYLPTQYTLQDELGIDGGIYPDASLTETAIDGLELSRGKNYLDHEIQTILDFWIIRNVPMNFGEWGTADSAIADESTGGIIYIGDMLNLMGQNNLNWQFYYMNRLYRIDCCFADNPTTVLSQDLINKLSNYLENGNVAP